MRPWEKNTMTVVFSSTKAIGALIIAILVSRGHLHYEDKVICTFCSFNELLQKSLYDELSLRLSLHTSIFLNHCPDSDQIWKGSSVDYCTRQISYVFW